MGRLRRWLEAAGLIALAVGVGIGLETLWK